MLIRRIVLVVGSLASWVLASGVAHAEVSVDVCSDAYTKGQEERLAGRLFSAREQFEVCSDSSCPKAFVRDCLRWLTEVEADLPSLLVRVTDTAGRTPDGLSVFFDGRAVAVEALEQPLVTSAGPHVLRFEAPGYQPVELSPALRPEDRKLKVNALMRLEAAVDTPAVTPSVSDAPKSKGVPVATLTFASIGVVALGGSLYFGLSAKSRYDDLKAHCAPTCSQSQIDSVHSKAVISDIALATSVVAFGAAAWFYFSAKPDDRGSTALRIEPSPQGARAQLRVVF